jgi:cation-transporting ATPase 13A1
MIVDFMGCWVIEVVCKYLFADLEPKAMVTKGRERREQRRLIEEEEKEKANKSQQLEDEEGSKKLKVQ